MKFVNARLFIAGTGNYMEQVRELVRKHNLHGKVVFLGNQLPADLRTTTRQAFIGVTLFEEKGLSNYFSLANRYFDYMHAGVPQLCVDYPVYHELNKIHPVAVLTPDLDPQSIALRLNMLLEDNDLYRELQANCLIRREELNWQAEEIKLINFYNTIPNS